MFMETSAKVRQAGQKGRQAMPPLSFQESHHVPSPPSPLLLSYMSTPRLPVGLVLRGNFSPAMVTAVLFLAAAGWLQHQAALPQAGHGPPRHGVGAEPGELQPHRYQAGGRPRRRHGAGRRKIALRLLIASSYHALPSWRGPSKGVIARVVTGFKSGGQRVIPDLHKNSA